MNWAECGNIYLQPQPLETEAGEQLVESQAELYSDTLSQRVKKQM